MDELRRVALECAARLAPPCESALTTVARAEVFLDWLERRAGDPLDDDLRAKVDALDRVIAAAHKPPPLPSNHDLAQADQSPPRKTMFQAHGHQIGGTREDMFASVIERDPDDIPTRLVRPPNDAA